MSAEDRDGDRGHQPPPSTWGFLGAALQMAASISLGVSAGWWLDHRCDWAPWGVIGGVVLGTVVGLYVVLKEAG
jgi:F0F1-type ATP synthase assembly protein I